MNQQLYFPNPNLALRWDFILRIHANLFHDLYFFHFYMFVIFSAAVQLKIPPLIVDTKTQGNSAISLLRLEFFKNIIIHCQLELSSTQWL